MDGKWSWPHLGYYPGMSGRTEENNEGSIRLFGVVAKIQTEHALIMSESLVLEPIYLALQLNEHYEPKKKLRIPCMHKDVL